MLKETFWQIEMLTFFYSSWCTYSGNLLIFIITVAIENYKSESSLFNSFYGAFDFYMQTKEKKTSQRIHVFAFLTKMYL
ncbi:hypothetical protein T12_14350 [Trichinella patagoniensis]|uniref:Uncharacterized protein n=1 Tax=Trichinella patagoniensis TaxID=990121 RepID=A0A0V0ZD97_9BILA|nr:hypothetical protein T12_14350 [Trichinella patagoniensis]